MKINIVYKGYWKKGSTINDINGEGYKNGGRNGGRGRGPDSQ